MNKAIIGIDASNIRGGGGVTHLVEILSNVNPKNHDITKVVVWGGKQTLNYLKNQPWLEKINPDELNKNLLKRVYWQVFKLTNEVYSKKCDLLFVPGGSYWGSFKPVVSMSQNLLPFDIIEQKRFPLIKQLRYYLLRIIQSRTFKKSQGLIFLSQYAKNLVLKSIDKTEGSIAVIHHGVSSRFKNQPKNQKTLSDFSENNPFKILYVSILNWYKHQDKVVKAVLKLREEGYPVVLDLVGSTTNCVYNKIIKIKNDHLYGNCIKIHGFVKYDNLDIKYKSADLFVFASTCENMPNILIEAMSAGLPIACSKKQPMPEFLKDGGLYFDAKNESEIESTIKEYLNNLPLREAKAEASYQLSKIYSWEKCAFETFNFLNKMAKYGIKISKT